MSVYKRNLFNYDLITGGISALYSGMKFIAYYLEQNNLIDFPNDEATLKHRYQFRFKGLQSVYF